MYGYDTNQAIIENDNCSISTNNNRKFLEESKKLDRGYNKIYRNVQRSNGQVKKVPIEVYTSGCMGNNIRDAETGEYYQNIVGSKDEDLFFSVILATGECKSPNKSSTLFYLSPENYAKHLKSTVHNDVIHNWEMRRDFRLKEMNINTKSNMKSNITVN